MLTLGGQRWAAEQNEEMQALVREHEPSALPYHWCSSHRENAGGACIV